MKLTCADPACERPRVRKRPRPDGTGDGWWCMYHPTETAPDMDMVSGKLRGPDGKPKKEPKAGAPPKPPYRAPGRVIEVPVDEVDLPDEPDGDDDLVDVEPDVEVPAQASPTPTRPAPPRPRPAPTPAAEAGSSGWRTPRPAAPAAQQCGHVMDLPTRLLVEHPGNVRTDLGDLTELQQSVLAQGILQPLLVTRADDGRYVVIGGHRRLAAAVAVELPRVPVMLRSQLDGTAAVEAMLVENLQRADLDPVDEAKAYQQLLDSGRTRAQIAKAVGKSEAHLSVRLALLNLTKGELDNLRAGGLTLQEAYQAGRARSGRALPAGQRRPKPRRVPHFVITHPQAETAASSCEHETTLKLGVACGPCWENAIRQDERRRLGHRT